MSFLTEAPTADAVDAARGVKAGADLWEVVGGELHIRYANGAGQAELSQDALTRKL